MTHDEILEGLGQSDDPELGQINQELPVWRKIAGFGLIAFLAYMIYSNPRIQAEIKHRKKGWK